MAQTLEATYPSNHRYFPVSQWPLRPSWPCIRYLLLYIPHVLEYGFFYLDITKYADPSEPEELTKLAREFFALPQHEKDKIALKNE